MATLNIQVSRAGIDKISADTTSVSDVLEAGELLRATGLATRLLHQAVREHFAADCPPTAEELPKAWVPSYVDGLQDTPRELKILVSDGPRDPFDDPPQWFIDSVKSGFPDHPFWVNAKDLPGGDGETAVMIFEQAMKQGHWLDNWGFCEVVRTKRVDAKDRPQSLDEWRANRTKQHPDSVEQEATGEEILVAEPYGISLTQLVELIPFFARFGWTFNIVGKSAHYPSATIRLEIQPKESQ